MNIIYCSCALTCVCLCVCVCVLTITLTWKVQILYILKLNSYYHIYILNFMFEWPCIFDK